MARDISEPSPKAMQRMLDLGDKGFRVAGMLFELDEGEHGITRVVVAADGRFLMISGFLVEWPDTLVDIFGPPKPT